MSLALLRHQLRYDLKVQLRDRQSRALAGS